LRNARKNYRRHIVDIPRIIFSGMTKSLGKRAFSDSLLVSILIYETLSSLLAPFSEAPGFMEIAENINYSNEFVLLVDD